MTRTMAPKRTRTMNCMIPLAAAAVLALLLGAAEGTAGTYDIHHPLCDGSTPCKATVVWFKGHGESIDRIEAHIDGTCQVTRNDGTTATASTETLSLSNGTATTDGISRTWRFPTGCNAWFHARHPRGYPFKDLIWTTTKSTDQDNVVNDPFEFYNGDLQ